MTPATELTPWYALALGAVAAAWLWQVAKAGRRRMWPRLAVLLPLGLGAMISAPQQEAPSLFGFGVGLALLGVYMPAWQAAKPQRVWKLIGLLLGLLLLGLGVGQAAFLLKVLGGVTALQSTAGLLWAACYPASAPQPARLPGLTHDPLWRRWRSADIPARPDLELTLDIHSARIVNVSGQPLELMGWSPASRNAWLRVRQRDGALLMVLPAGATAYLLGWQPLSGRGEGVRLWYGFPGQDDTYLFRADWSGSAVNQEAHERVLN